MSSYKSLTFGGKKYTISRNYYSPHATRQNIKETFPSLLLACSESRRTVRSFYRSTFPEPKMEPLKWHFDLQYSHELICSIAEDVVPEAVISEMDRDISKTKHIILKIEKYMNNPLNKDQESQFSEYASQYQSSRQQISPAFFSPKDDILYLSPGNLSHGMMYLPGLWSPVGKRKIHKIHSIAIPLHHLGGYGGWTSFNPQKCLRGVEELWLVCDGDQEVIHLKLDPTNLLKPGTWSFSWSLDCNTSKQLAEGNFEPVTWHVNIAASADRKKTFWELVGKWRPNYRVWEMDKKRILKSQPVPKNWRRAIRCLHILPNCARAPVVMPGGDGHTWIGMSKDDEFFLWAGGNLTPRPLLPN
jgi:hypothetical protein